MSQIKQANNQMITKDRIPSANGFGQLWMGMHQPRFMPTVGAVILERK